MRTIRDVVVSAFVLVLTSAPVWAQATAELSGRVTDESAAVLPGVPDRAAGRQPGPGGEGVAAGFGRDGRAARADPGGTSVQLRLRQRPVLRGSRPGGQTAAGPVKRSARDGAAVSA